MEREEMKMDVDGNVKQDADEEEEFPSCPC